jgi:agmatinase
MTYNPEVLTWCGAQWGEPMEGKWVNNPGDVRKPLLTSSDMCIVGLPYDAGQTGVSGQSAAPSAIRRLETLESWRTHDIGDLSTVKLVDLGDLGIDHRRARDSLIDAMRRVNAAWRNTGTMVALGGDHSISAAMLESCPVQRPIVIHLDAHRDTWTDEAFTEEDLYPHHASWVGWVLSKKYTSGVYQFGVRTMGPDVTEDGHYENLSTHTGQVSAAQLKSFINHIKKTDVRAPVYLSIDMDVVDPAFCPGVAYPEPGGWTSRELLTTVEFLVEKLNVIGVDIVEITPSLDVRDMSVRLAHRTVLAVMRGIKRKQI